jgi:hypothetical protein
MPVSGHDHRPQSRAEPLQTCAEPRPLHNGSAPSNYRWVLRRGRHLTAYSSPPKPAPVPCLYHSIETLSQAGQNHSHNVLNRAPSTPAAHHLKPGPTPIAGQSRWWAQGRPWGHCRGCARVRTCKTSPALHRTTAIRVRTRHEPRWQRTTRTPSGTAQNAAVCCPQTTLQPQPGQSVYQDFQRRPTGFRLAKTTGKLSSDGLST